jgi:Ca2+-binding RTX toxin-like protein
MRRFINRLLANSKRSLARRRLLAAKHARRQLGCEPLEARRQLASITLTLDANMLLSLVDSEQPEEIANDLVTITDDGEFLEINLGADSVFNSNSTDFGMSGGDVVYSSDNTVATIAKSLIASISIVLDDADSGVEPGDIVTWGLADGFLLPAITLPTALVTANAVNFRDNLALEGNLTITADSIAVDGSIQGPYNLAVVGADATFSGQLGSPTVPLGDGGGFSLTLDGGVVDPLTPSATGAFNFAADVYLASGATATANTDVAFNGDFTSVAGEVVLEGNVSVGGNLFQSEGAVTLGTAGADPLNSLRITSESPTRIHSLTAGVTVHAATILESDLEIEAADDGIELNGPVDGHSLGAQSLVLSSTGITKINGAIGGDIDLRDVATDAAGSTDLAANITVLGGNITFNDPVTLASDVTLKGGSGSQIEFNETLSGSPDGGNSLILDNPNGSYFRKAVGAGAPVGDDTGPAITILNGAAEFENTVATGSGIVQDDAAGVVTFRGAVDLGAGDVDSDFSGSVVLAGITFTSAGHVAFGNDSSDTLRIQDASTVITEPTGGTGTTFTVNATTTLAADLAIQAGAGDIVLNGTVNDAEANTHNLTLNSAGATSINAEIGGVRGLRSLVTDGVGADEEITHIAANVSVGTGGVSFHDAVQLTGDIHLVVTTGNASFAKTVMGGDLLSLDVDGATTFDMDVGGTEAGEAIGDGTGEALVILSAGTTTFGGDVVTNSGIRQAATAGLVVFSAYVTVGEGDSADGVGSIFDGDVELQGTTFTAGREVRFGAFAGGGAAAGDNTLTLSTGPVAIRTVANDGGIVFAAAIDGANTLTLAAHGAGGIQFLAVVGGDVPPSALTIEDADTALFQLDATLQDEVDVTTAGLISVNRTLSSLAHSIKLQTTMGGSIAFEALSAAVRVDLRSDDAVQLVLPDRIPTDIAAPELRITANNGIGAAAPLKTAVAWLAASNASMGDIRVLNAGPETLNIDVIDDLLGVSNTAAGAAVTLRNGTSIAVLQPVIANGAVTLTANGTADGNFILVAADITSEASTVSLSSGDDMTVDSSKTIRAAGKITLAGDTASVDGSEITIFGSVITTATAPESILIVTGGGSDNIWIPGRLQTSSPTADAIAISTGMGDDLLAIDSNGGTATSGGSVAGILSRLTYRSGTGTDSLTLDNSGRTIAQSVTITPLANLAGLFAGSIGAGVSDSYFATGVYLSYDSVENVTLSTGGANDTINATAFFDSATARRTNFVFAENPANLDTDTLLLNYTRFPENSSPYVLATTAQGRALAGVDSSGRQFGSLRWDDIESIQAVIPRIVGTVPGDALFLAGRTLFNDIARYTGTTEAVTLSVNGIHFESHAGVQKLIAYGRSGNDRITVDNPAIDIPVEFRGEQGADYLSGGAANDLILGDLETDTTGGKDTIFGQGGDDTLRGFAANDLIHGNLGNDSIDGGNGNDVLYGNEGQDIIRGGAGNDALYGVSGNDVLLGEAGSDKLYAGPQRSLLIGGTGSDYLYGQAGDILVGGHVSNTGNDAFLSEALNAWVSGTSPGPITQANRDTIRLKLGARTDTERDYLTGSTTTSVLDWFFASATDVFTRRASTDFLN